MGALFARLTAWLAGLVGWEAARDVALFIAWKAFIVSVVLILFPIMLTNWLVYILGIIFGVITQHVQGQGGLGPTVVSLTGLAGCLGDQLRLADSMGLIISAIAFRVAMQLIPFVGLGR